MSLVVVKLARVFASRRAFASSHDFGSAKGGAPVARDLVRRFRQTGRTVYVLAGHRSQYNSDALAALQRGTRRVDITRLYGTLIYRLAF